MENEFIDLIRTFDKTATRLETLDENILKFKDVIEGLRGNLDELVEMVQLEGIIELSELSQKKLLALNSEMNQFEKTNQRLENQINLVSKLIKEDSTTIDDHFYYRLNEETVEVINKNQMEEPKQVEGLKIKKISSHLNATFALDSSENVLYLLNGTKFMTILEMPIEDFVVSNYFIYLLAAGNLEKINLLTKEKELILSNIEKIELMVDEKHLLCTNKMNEMRCLNL